MKVLRLLSWHILKFQKNKKMSEIDCWTAMKAIVAKAGEILTHATSNTCKIYFRKSSRLNVAGYVTGDE